MQYYAMLFGPLVGPWNLCAKGMKMDYVTMQFFEDHLLPVVPENGRVCNIGIGVGFWDRAVSYAIGGKCNGRLTSIDKDSENCELFRQCLEFEGHPFEIEVYCEDVTKLDYMFEEFDVVTMVGSTVFDSCLQAETMFDACSFLLKPGGILFYMSAGNIQIKTEFEKHYFSSDWKLKASKSEKITDDVTEYMWCIKKNN